MRPVAVEADYFDRISAMEFAVRNDDGVMPETPPGVRYLPGGRLSLR